MRGVSDGRPDRICVDARSLAGKGTGITTYTRGLIAALGMDGGEVGLLEARGPSQAWLRVLRACLPGSRRLSAQGADLIGWDIFRFAQVRFDMQGTVTRLRAPGPPGVMHWTYPMPLMIGGWANLYTVHDTIPLTAPQHSAVNSKRHCALLSAIGSSASHIVTVSDAARDDIVAALGWAPDRVVNCGQAVMPGTSTGRLPDGCLSRGYLLFCGRIEARKNLPRLFAAYRASGTSLPLLLAGPMVEGSETILAHARDVPGIRYLDYLDRADLVALIANACALLLPSLAEGFGLPVAEAMALGTPALISRDPALVETAGGAALMVDADDEAAIAQAIARLASDDNLRAVLADRGRARAAAFTPEAFAARLCALYASLAV